MGSGGCGKETSIFALLSETAGSSSAYFLLLPSQIGERGEQPCLTYKSIKKGTKNVQCSTNVQIQPMTEHFGEFPVALFVQAPCFKRVYPIRWTEKVLSFPRLELSPKLSPPNLSFHFVRGEEDDRRP